MEFVFLIIGIMIGLVVHHIYDKNRSIRGGTLEIDHSTGFCRCKISSTELANTKCRYAEFKITHNAIITEDDWLDSIGENDTGSRDNQSL